MMDKKYFEVVNSYGSAVEKIHSKLESMGINSDELDKMFAEANSLYDKYLKLGKELDENQFIGEETTLKESFEDLPAYTRIELIYRYDNGFHLCGTTDLETYLIPSKLLNL